MPSWQPVPILRPPQPCTPIFVRMQTLSSRGLAPCLVGPRLAVTRLHARRPLRQRHAGPVASSRDGSFDSSDLGGLEGLKHVVREQSAVARSVVPLGEHHQIIRPKG